MRWWIDKEGYIGVNMIECFPIVPARTNKEQANWKSDQKAPIYNFDLASDELSTP